MADSHLPVPCPVGSYFSPDQYDRLHEPSINFLKDGKLSVFFYHEEINACRFPRTLAIRGYSYILGVRKNGNETVIKYEGHPAHIPDNKTESLSNPHRRKLYDSRPHRRRNQPWTECRNAGHDDSSRSFPGSDHRSAGNLSILNQKTFHFFIKSAKPGFLC